MTCVLHWRERRAYASAILKIRGKPGENMSSYPLDTWRDIRLTILPRIVPRKCCSEIDLSIWDMAANLGGLSRSIFWKNMCLSATLYIVGMVLIAQDANVGGRLVGAAFLLGPAIVGTLWGGIIVSRLDYSHIIQYIFKSHSKMCMCT